MYFAKRLAEGQNIRDKRRKPVPTPDADLMRTGARINQEVRGRAKGTVFEKEESEGEGGGKKCGLQAERVGGVICAAQTKRRCRDPKEKQGGDQMKPQGKNMIVQGEETDEGTRPASFRLPEPCDGGHPDYFETERKKKKNSANHTLRNCGKKKGRPEIAEDVVFDRYGAWARKRHKKKALILYLKGGFKRRKSFLGEGEGDHLKRGERPCLVATHWKAAVPQSGVF